MKSKEIIIQFTLLSLIVIMPMIRRITGEMRSAVIGSPPKDSMRPMYGVPRNAPILSPESVRLEARKDRWGGTCA